MSERNELCGAASAAQTTDALILPKYAEIARYAVQLAADRVVYENGSPHRTCTICLNVGGLNDPVCHDKSCIIGRIFALTSEIARLRFNVPDRSIEYSAYTTPLGDDDRATSQLRPQLLLDRGEVAV